MMVGIARNRAQRGISSLHKESLLRHKAFLKLTDSAGTLGVWGFGTWQIL